jgi:Ca2+-binding RTX toxin-like protein
MPDYFLTSNPVPGSNYVTTVDDSTFTLFAGVDAIDVTVDLVGNDSIIRIAGQLSAGPNPITLGNYLSNAFGNELIVRATGAIVSFDGFAAVLGGASVFNDGSISGADGISLRITANDSSSIINSGRITGDTAIRITNAGTAELLFLRNSGTIDGTTAVTTNGALSMINSGSITGSISSGNTDSLIDNTGMISGSIGMGNLQDVILNTGTITDSIYMVGGNDILDNRQGDLLNNVFMGSGNDRLDNRGGFIRNQINLEDGNDTLVLGSGIENADGGNGARDVIDIRAGAGGTTDFNASRSTGLAQGDVLVGFETIFGSVSGADLMYGNGAANLFYGFGGNDRMLTGSGNDFLDGGEGRDTLIGGAGDDSFKYRRSADFGDIITDFSSAAAGNNDRLIFDVSGIGGGLTAGALSASQFQTRADNLAQDSNDRFIFRTTDRSLWYDANGSGSGGAVMVADLQAGATVTALDILLT